jgi:hypothetical protein
MSTTNNAVLFCSGFPTVEVVPGPAATQSTAVRLTNRQSRITKSVATGSVILPSIGTGEANEPMLVINDTAGTVNIYPATGEKTNGAANTAFAVTTGLTGICVPVLASTYNYPSTLDWRCALIP